MIAKRMEGITSFIVMDVLEKANEMERHGLDVIHLEVGQPDFETPGCIKQAAEKALRDGYTHYTHSQGIMELRQAICEDYKHQYGVNIDPEQIIVTSGTSPAMMILFSVLKTSRIKKLRKSKNTNPVSEPCFHYRVNNFPYLVFFCYEIIFGQSVHTLLNSA